MVYTRKKRQQNKRLFSQLSEFDTKFMVEQNNHESQTGNKVNVARGDIPLNNANNPTQFSGSQVDMYRLEKNIVNDVRREVDSVMTTVEKRVHDAVLTAIESLVIPRIELAMKSVNASSVSGVDSVVLDPDPREFSAYIEGLQFTTSSRINLHTDFNRIEETHGNITVEGGDLTVIWKKD